MCKKRLKEVTRHGISWVVVHSLYSIIQVFRVYEQDIVSGDLIVVVDDVETVW